MAQAVARSLENQTNLVVQAGTGVGKSLGYLVPLMVRSAQGDGIQLVSTASLALQRQIITHDGPLVQEVIAKEMGTDVSIGLLKGWSNYLCRYRLQGGFGDEEMLWDEAGQGKIGREQVDKLREWAEDTDTGDRDDVDFTVGAPSWAQVSVSKRECLGQTCPFIQECFPQQAKERAFASDVVVTNHALLGVYANGRTEVLPEFEALVVDEAHDLAVRVRSQGTEQLSVSAIRRAARSVRKCSSAAAADLEDARDDFSSALDQVESGLVTARPEGLNQAIRKLDDAIRKGRTELKNVTGSAKAGGEMQMARAHLDALSSGIEAWAGEPEWSITWVGENSGGFPVLNLAPLNVASLMAEHLFSEHPTILASATLALGGSFDQIRIQTGIERGSKDCEYLDVGTSFDPAKQGILYVARHLPEPNRQGVAEDFYQEFIELTTAAGGGVLGLFSSMQGAQNAAEQLREATDLQVFVQGEDNLPALVKAFKDNRDSCLLGTISLWQGVDVPGPACRLVIIDRIPFPRPDDPIGQAQSRAATKERRSAFVEVSLAPAALLMAQGSGRLLRASSDRGVIAVLDSRMATRKYGGFITNSMLPFWKTEDPALVRAALQRLATEVQADEGLSKNDEE